MFFLVQVAGWIWFWIAAFSAGSPNASHPMGVNTENPCMRFSRVTTSLNRARLRSSC